MEQPAARTRMNLTQNAKGRVAFDVTAEYDTPEKTAEELGKALDLVKKTIVDRGLTPIETI
jgi:hypothetical protein